MLLLIYFYYTPYYLFFGCVFHTWDGIMSPIMFLLGYAVPLIIFTCFKIYEAAQIGLSGYYRAMCKFYLTGFFVSTIWIGPGINIEEFWWLTPFGTLLALSVFWFYMYITMNLWVRAFDYENYQRFRKHGYEPWSAVLNSYDDDYRP